MALQSGRYGFSEVGLGLEFNNVTGRLSLNGETDISLDGLKDVSIVEAADGDVLVYDGTSEEWYNESPDTIPYISGKADITAIGTYETGNTASKAYAVGEHFYKNGKFCTAIAAIASGETFTLGTNYVEGDIASSLGFEDVTSEFTKTSAALEKSAITAYRSGHVIEVIVQGGSLSVPANDRVKIATYTDKVKPVDISVTEAAGVNFPGNPTGTCIMADGLYLVNNTSSEKYYVQGRMMYITKGF